MKLCIGAYKGKNQVQIHGVVRKSGRGVPPCKVRGTVKAAVFEGGPSCPSICCAFYYNAKMFTS